MITMPNGQTMPSIEFHFYEWCIIVKNLSGEDMDALTDEQFQALKEEYVEALKGAIEVAIEWVQFVDTVRKGGPDND